MNSCNSKDSNEKTQRSYSTQVTEAGLELSRTPTMELFRKDELTTFSL